MGGGGGEGLPSVSKLGEVPNSFPQRILLSSLLELTGGSRGGGWEGFDTKTRLQVQVVFIAR